MAIEHSLAFFCVALLGTLTSITLFELYGDKLQIAGGQRITSWMQRWDFSPLSMGGFSYGPLILASLVGLFLELLLIRWISSEIRIFAYLKNFVLVACLLGFGLGCHLCRRRINLLPLVVPLVFLALLIRLPWRGLRQLIEFIPFYLGAFSEVHVWGVPSLPLSLAAIPNFLAAVFITVPLFALLSLVFIPIGQLIGWYLENAGNGITGYSANVLASLAGILLYTLLCFLDQPPPVWFAAAGAMLILLVWKVGFLRWMVAAALLFCTALLTIPERSESALNWSSFHKLPLTESTEGPVHWSPYQKLSLTSIRLNGELIAYSLKTNNTWYQQIINLSPEFVSSHRDLLEGAPTEFNPYNIPYRFFFHPPDVLILGAGMGNDVAAALRNGAECVVAVEIDPLIFKLGKDLHFERPYDSPRVTRVLNDARSYVQNTRDRFDLIVFSLLDSVINTSHFSNIRIDNYVYTREALVAARQLLKPDGLFIVKFQVDTPWIAGRLKDLLTSVFGYAPLQLHSDTAYSTPGTFFIAGSPGRVKRSMEDPKLAAYVRRHSDIKTVKATLTTDDWPYFYQHEPGLPVSVIVISIVLLLLCWLAMRRTGFKGASMNWHFFFLGAGFLLLEVQIVSKVALLFGTTWIVNSIVISGILLLIVGSNILVQKVPGIAVRLAYAGLFSSIAISYGVPLEWLFFRSIWLKALSSTLVLCLPVFFAGIIFIKSFARFSFSGDSLGSNLIGALAGGMLESISLWTGLKSLLIVAALLYLVSYLSLARGTTQNGLPALEISEAL